MYKDLREINKKNVLKSLKSNNYVILRGLFNKKEVNKVLNNIKKKI